jgi:hypothetical protein
MPATLRRRFARLFAGVTCAAAVSFLVPAPAYALPDQPLYDYQPVVSGLVDDEPSWQYSTRFMYWSVIAVRPPSAGWQMSLSVLYSGGRLWSQPTDDGVNLIAVDSNMGRRTFDEYHALASYNNGPPTPPGPYTIMVAQGPKMAYTGTNTINYPNGSFVAVRDLYINAGQQITVFMNPTDLGYLYGSDPANSATWVQARNSASARTTLGIMQYTAPRSGFYGLVLVNRRGVATSTVWITAS